LFKLFFGKHEILNDRFTSWPVTQRPVTFLSALLKFTLNDQPAKYIERSMEHTFITFSICLF